MLALDSMLKLAASADEWTRVVHRCAWCKRVADERGEYSRIVVLGEATVVTDGICPRCGKRALAELAERRRLREQRAA
jgi:galactose-1-phosphate uridylyltransferase